MINDKKNQSHETGDLTFIKITMQKIPYRERLFLYILVNLLQIGT
jgi:hypothetical protein